MDYFSAHKRSIFIAIYVIILIAVPLAAYLFINQHPKPGSCLILEEKYCKSVVFIKNPNQESGLLAAYKIPENTTLYAPINGLYSNKASFGFKNATSGSVESYQGATITISPSEEAATDKTIYSLVYFKAGKDFDNQNIEKGQIISKVSNKNIEAAGDYNLLVGITKQTFLGQAPANSSQPKFEFSSDNEGLKKMLEKK